LPLNAAWSSGGGDYGGGPAAETAHGGGESSGGGGDEAVGPLWLKHQCETLFAGGATPVQDMCVAIFDQLASPKGDDLLQNDLFDLLGFDRCGIRGAASLAMAALSVAVAPWLWGCRPC